MREVDVLIVLSVLVDELNEHIVGGSVGGSPIGFVIWLEIMGGEFLVSHSPVLLDLDLDQSVFRFDLPCHESFTFALESIVIPFEIIGLVFNWHEFVGNLSLIHI